MPVSEASPRPAVLDPIAWQEGISRPIAEGAYLCAFKTGAWTVRLGDGTVTEGKASNLRAARKSAEEGQDLGRATWKRLAVATLPGDVSLSISRQYFGKGWVWFFNWSRFTVFSGSADSLQAAKAAVAAKVRTDIMAPLWLEYKRYGYALNPAAIPQKIV